MAVLTMTARKGILEVPFITAFHILLLFCRRSIFDTVVSSELYFNRLIVVKRQRVGVSRSLLQETMAVYHCYD